MAAVLDRVPTDKIQAEAAQIRLGRLLLTVIGALFFAVGWVFGRAWLGIATILAAVKVGFAEGRKPRPPDGGP